MIRASTESSSSVTVSLAQALRAVAMAWPMYCSAENAVPRQSSVSSLRTSSSSSPTWRSASIDEGEQLERGHVLAVGRRVDRDALVELGEPLLHHAAT